MAAARAAFGGDAFVEAVRLQGRESGGIVRLLGHCLEELVAIVGAVERRHELDVLRVLAVVFPELVDRHLDEVRAGRR
jgi:hypothetical protein